MARLAKQYLSIQATEVASERIFSTAGGVLTKLRSQLDPGTVDAIIFLHKNYVLQVQYKFKLAIYCNNINTNNNIYFSIQSQKHKYI